MVWSLSGLEGGVNPSPALQGVVFGIAGVFLWLGCVSKHGQLPGKTISFFEILF
jgi:hypothetical protein